MAEAPKVLLTGAAGDVAALARPTIVAHVSALRLTDARRPVWVARNETFLKARLEKRRELARALEGIEAVVHFAAASKGADWQELQRVDIGGVRNLLEEARIAGVRRIILAGTLHVMGLYRRDEPISEDAPARPDSPYAAAKVFMEAYARMYAEKYRMRITVLRLAHVVGDLSAGEPCNVVLGADVGRLVVHELAQTRVGFRVLHVVSPCPGDSVTDGRLASEGFEFIPHLEPYDEARARLPRWFGDWPAAINYRGGAYAVR